MTGSKSQIPTSKILSSLLMIVTLLWLSVSAPFVSADQKIKKEVTEKKATDKNDNNPYSNTNEEKSETGVNTLSEYLHEVTHLEHPYTIVQQFYKCHSTDLYFAYHPELISPPPEA